MTGGESGLDPDILAAAYQACRDAEAALAEDPEAAAVDLLDSMSRLQDTVRASMIALVVAAGLDGRASQTRLAAAAGVTPRTVGRWISETRAQRHEEGDDRA